VNQLSIQLSNEAMARGLHLAQARGVGSLEELIELLLREIDAPQLPDFKPSRSTGRTPSAEPPAPPGFVELTGAVDPQVAVAQPTFPVNPPALTLDRPAAPPPLELAGLLPPSIVPLPFLTNRLSPLKASVRALANLATRDGQWPRLRDFQAKAGHAARERGAQLQAEDRAAGRRARQKRSIAWPVGANPATALERYAFAFTLAADNGTPTGPLASLGLATLVDGRAALTAPGWELAAADSPVLDGGEGTLSQDEVTILRDRLVRSSPERQAISEFIRAVRRAAGAQPRIDELLSTWHSEWSAEQAAAQRSAMIGRLEELGLLEVTGRGAKAAVTLGDVGEFEQDISERSAA
jgi:hypothetical protein